MGSMLNRVRVSERVSGRLYCRWSCPSKLGFTFKGAKTYGFHPWGTQYNNDQEVLQNFISGTRRKKYNEVVFTLKK